MNNERPIRPGMAPGLIVRSGPKATLAGSDVGVFVPLSALEPNLPATPKTMIDLVSRLDRDAALLLCGVVNILVTGSGGTDVTERQRRAFNTVGTREDDSTIGGWLRSQRLHDASPVVFFQGQILELLRWIVVYAEPGTGQPTYFADPENRKTFLRAALVASELWSARTIGDRLSGGKTNGESVERALGAFRKSIEEGGIATHLGVAIARGSLLFQRYLPARLPTFRDDFATAMGMTIEDFLACVTMLMPKASDVPSEGPLFRASYAAATEFAAPFALFLDQMSQTPDELRDSLESGFVNNGFRAIREKPILTTPSGLNVILDPAYFVGLLTISPLFKVVALGRQVNAVFGAFGDAFEDYAIDILERCYPAHFGVQRLFTRVKSCDENPEFEIDALLNEGTDLVIIETKAAFVPERSILADDHSHFLKELRKKYAVEPGEQDREVGVAQLARQIRAIVVDRWAGAEIDHSQLRQIFPVLVVYDEQLASPGVGAFLNNRFREALGQFKRTDVIIRDLTIMTIHDLETKESTGGFSLTELLSNYLPESRGGMVSLHNFLARHSTFSAMIRPNQTLLSTSLAQLQELQKRLFPKLESDGATVEPQ